MEIARFGVLQAHLPRQRAHAIEPVASNFGRRTRLLAAMASWNRAVASRFDKLKRNYESVVAMACAFLWLPM